MTLKYKRVLFKITGEVFGSVETGRGIETARFQRIARYIKHLKDTTDVEIVVLLGGGNIYRGRNATDPKFDHAQADYAGMLATDINAILLQGELEILEVETRVMSSLEINKACEPYIRRKALRHLDDGTVVILAGGIGEPFFTTDTAAALRAAGLACDVLLKGTSGVEGVYTADPKLDPTATMYTELSYQEALEKGLKIMDSTAFATCQTQKIPIIVFNIDNLENIGRILNGEKIGTIIR